MSEHDSETVERVARAICESVIRDRVLGNTHTVWTDWRPEALAALDALEPLEYAECTCGHYYSDHVGEVCGFYGCGCGYVGEGDD